MAEDKKILLAVYRQDGHKAVRYNVENITDAQDIADAITVLMKDNDAFADLMRDTVTNYLVNGDKMKITYTKQEDEDI